MAPLGFSARLQRQVNASTPGNQQQNGRTGAYHRGLNSLTRLNNNSGPRVAATAVARNVPRPVQTSSLKKENGGQDVNAVLVNRNNGSGKKVGWGSALPATNAAPAPPISSEPTPAETSSLVSSEKQQTQTNSNQQLPPDDLPQPQHHPHLVPPPPPTSTNRNSSWASHSHSAPNPPSSAVSNGVPSNAPTDEAEHCPPTRHNDQEKNDHNLQQVKNPNHIHNHDNINRQEPHLNDHHGGDRYEKDERFSHLPYPDHRRPSFNTYRDRGEPYDRSYPRGGFDSRSDFRDRDYRYGYDNRYDHRDRDRDYRDRNWFDRERGASLAPYDHRGSNVPHANYHPRGRYQRHEERRWGDDDFNGFSRRAGYVPDRPDMPHHNVQVGPGPVDENYERRRNHDPRGFRSEDPPYERGRRDGYGPNNNFPGSHQHSHSYSWNHTHPGPLDERARFLIPPRNDNLHQTVVKIEDEIAMQAVREREAVEARIRRQKELSTSDRSGQIEKERCTVNEKSCSIQPIAILRNEQVNMKASDDASTHVTSKKCEKQAHSPKESRPQPQKLIQSQNDIESPNEVDLQKDTHSQKEVEPHKDTKCNREVQPRSENVARKTVQPRKESNFQKQVECQNVGKFHEESLPQSDLSTLKIIQSQKQIRAESENIQEVAKTHERENDVQGQDFKENDNFDTPIDDACALITENSTNKIVTTSVKEKVDANQSDTTIKPKDIEKEELHQHEEKEHEGVESTEELKKNLLANDDTNTNETYMKEEKDEKQVKEEQALEQQQNVLRHVAASRKSNKNAKTSIRKNEKKNRVTKENKPPLPTEDDSPLPRAQKAIIDDQIKEEREAAEAKARAARAEHRRTRGPRTKGVLFRRLPDGTLVNADLSEEELARREERKKAREEKMRIREERIKAREKAREERIKAREEQRKVREEQKRNREEKANAAAAAAAATKEETSKADIPKDKRAQMKSPQSTSKETQTPTKPKPKIFVPAPPPAVSAWEAGPPRGFIAPASPPHQSPAPVAEPPKSSPLSKSPVLNMGAESGNEGSSAPNSARHSESSLHEAVDDTALCSSSESEVSIQFGSLEKRDLHWNSPHENHTTNMSKFSSMNAIALPITGVATWNAFGASNLFAPPHQDNGQVSADWSVRQDSNENDSAAKTMTWTDTHAATIAHPTIEDDEAAEITDASNAVPRDLLSSAPGSEDDNDASNEAESTKEGELKNHRQRNRSRNYVERRAPRNRTKQGFRKKRYPPRQDHTNKPSETEPSTQQENGKRDIDAIDSRGRRSSRKARGGPKKSSSDGENFSKKTTTFSGRPKKHFSGEQQPESSTNGDAQIKNRRPKRPIQRSRMSRKPRSRAPPAPSPAPATATATD